MTHIASKVFLLAQDGLISIQHDFKPTNERFHNRLVGRLAHVRLDKLFEDNKTGDWIELRVLDVGGLLEYVAHLGISRYQLGAGALCGEIAADSV